MSKAPTDEVGTLSVPLNPPEQSVYDERDRLVILTPCYGGKLDEPFAQSVIAVLIGAPTALFRLADGRVQELPVVATIITQPGESHIDRGRNTLIWQSRRTHYRNFLWIDADQPFLPGDIAMTWVRLMSGVRVLGGSVALKTLVATFAANLEKGKTGLDRDADGLLPGRNTGTGWLAFRHDVIDQIIAEWPKHIRYRLAKSINLRPDDAHIDRALTALAQCGLSADLDFISQADGDTKGKTVHAIFASGVTLIDGQRDWLSEDWMFCHRCLQLGIPIKIDPNIRIKHIGPYLYPPAPSELIAASLVAVSGKRPPFDAKLAAEAHAALDRLHHSITDDSISILHPTRRPEQALRIRELWLSRASNPKGIEYIFGVDAADQETAAQLSAFSFQLSAFGSAPGAVAPTNAAAAASKGRILIFAADDCEPPQDWDVLIREALAGQLHLPRLLWTSDGYTNQPVITHPIMTRALYEKNGNEFFSSAYPHLFCDTELTHRAMQAGEVIDARHIVLKHQHPMFTGMKPDKLHEERNSTEAWRIGSEIFARRNPSAKHPHAP